jgi:alpha-glucosidase
MSRQTVTGLWVVTLVFFAATGSALAQAPPRPPIGPPALTSPNGTIVVTLGIEGQLTWSVSLRGNVVLEPSRIAMTLGNGRVLGEKPQLTTSFTRRIDTVLKPPVRYKRAEVRDRFNETVLAFAGNYSLRVRAYDDGVAYQWMTRLPGDITVVNEDVTLAFGGDHLVYFPEETSLLSHQERQYKRLKISEIATGRFSSLPAMVQLPKGEKVVVTEADLFDYPGMDLTAGGPHTLKGLFPAYPKKVELKRDRDEQVVEREPYIAKTRGTRDFPWRLLVVAERDADLLSTDIVYRLASETTITDTSWIKPGKVAWDWWNGLNVYGVPFKSGVNTETYKHFIDFAAENGLEYIILDEGWYKLGDLLSITPGVDMEAIAAHAKQKNVGLIMWVIWKTLDLQMGPALDQFEKWGVKGIKVDFMQREDQWMVNYYERVAREAAKRKLLVDFHGAYKPTGLYRTWPNVITSEGVLGLEQSKWGDMASPDNAVTFPFIGCSRGRGLHAGRDDQRREGLPADLQPADEPGHAVPAAAMPSSSSPLQMLADSPSNYRRGQRASRSSPRCRRSGTRRACSARRWANTSSWRDGAGASGTSAR